MGVIEDVRKWLKEIPIWQELEKVPDRLTALEERMDKLEARLERRPGDTCDTCGEHAMRRTRTGRVMGNFGAQVRQDIWTCEKCGATEQRVVKLF
ncbi:hypothetical protein LJR235_002898 [Pararhizobium sp. LjRoot235]|uniref:hypothetical protein n=1 Tax=Pararhizobium sp. LjRoot235 TaxID=3342291 RepID=UPI003ED1502E